MIEKRIIQCKSGIIVKVFVLGCVSCALIGCLGFGFASAGIGASHNVDSFGIDSENPFVFTAQNSSSYKEDDTAIRESSALSSVATRDISSGIATIEAEEEKARIVAEEVARKEEKTRIAAAEAAKAAQAVTLAEEAAAFLPDVDWSVGKEAFIAEWSQRINTYLSGSPLADYGATFAEAAWNNGVDPRWSPAISNTESSKGACCFQPYNAWGWMAPVAWGSWEEAINAHVRGLATKYGYSITVENARKYCPPSYMDWYNKTLAQMMLI